MRIKKLVNALKEKYLSRTNRIVKVNFKGRQLHVVRGSLRSKVDRDDHWLFLLLSNSQTFFDVGANMGYISLLSFLINPKRRVFLVEPNREALKVAILNMLYNDSISQCTFYEAFASDQNFSETKLYTVGAGAAGSMYKSHAESAEQLNSFQVVRTITLDYLMEKYSTIPDFVKIDVEGAERFVLNGSRSLASRKSTRFFVEMHSNVELTMVENATQVLTWCQEVGYKAWYLKEHGELNSPGQIQTRGRCHLLLQPSEWEYPSFLNGVKENSELPPVL